MIFRGPVGAVGLTVMATSAAGVGGLAFVCTNVVPVMLMSVAEPPVPFDPVHSFPLGPLKQIVVPPTRPSPTSRSVTAVEPWFTLTPVLPAVHWAMPHVPTAKSDKAPRVTVAEADVVVSAWLVAVTVIVLLGISGVRLSVCADTIEPLAQLDGCEKSQPAPTAWTLKPVGRVVTGFGSVPEAGLGAV